MKNGGWSDGERNGACQRSRPQLDIFTSLMISLQVLSYMTLLTAYSSGTMRFVFDDGGRQAAGFSGRANDCVCRSISIATGIPYRQVYDTLNSASQGERTGKRKRGISSARTGVYKQTTRRYLESLGWRWVPTMRIGQGCKVHLHDGELPGGRLIVSVSRHLTAVIDGVIHDTHDPQREIAYFEPDTGRELKPGEQRNQNGIFHIGRRCVYGYWYKPLPVAP